MVVCASLRVCRHFRNAGYDDAAGGKCDERGDLAVPLGRQLERLLA